MLNTELARILIRICDAVYWKVTMMLALCKAVYIYTASILTESKGTDILLFIIIIIKIIKLGDF